MPSIDPYTPPRSLKEISDIEAKNLVKLHYAKKDSKDTFLIRIVLEIGMQSVPNAIHNS